MTHVNLHGLKLLVAALGLSLHTSQLLLHDGVLLPQHGLRPTRLLLLHLQLLQHHQDPKGHVTGQPWWTDHTPPNRFLEGNDGQHHRWFIAQDLAELLHFVLGNGGLLPQSDAESLPLLGFWVSLGSRLEEIRHQ